MRPKKGNSISCIETEMKMTFINPIGALLRQMIDRILKTYGEANTTANGYPPENCPKLFKTIFFPKFSCLYVLCDHVHNFFYILTVSVTDEGSLPEIVQYGPSSSFVF